MSNLLKFSPVFFPTTTFVDLVLKTNKIAIQAPNTEVGDKTVGIDNMSKQLLLDVIREARAMNEIEVQKRTLTSHHQNAILEMGELQNSRNLFELTDDELLNAFASAKS